RLTNEPVRLSPALRGIGTAGAVAPSPVAHDPAPAMLVDQGFHQPRTIHARHGGVDIQTLRCFDGQMDRAFDLESRPPGCGLGRLPFSSLAASHLGWLGHNALPTP